ncbi:RTA1 like protein-domain-containing protein [Bisporella sp. PMI_857]|nr:RTA1 like protein-domain-containing protein [Bisporella sp. PMI_857]
MALERTRYRYDPSLAAAVVFAVAYGLVFIAYVIQWIKYRSWVWIVMVISAGMEVGGYIIRCLSINKPEERALYVAQFALIILAPVLMAGACYVLFGRIVFHIVPRSQRTLKLLWISPRWLTPIFVTADIVALIFQLIGAVRITSINATDPDARKKANQGRTIAQIGVAVQLLCFGLFTVIAVRFNFTARRFAAQFEQRLANADGKYCSIDGSERKLKRSWPTILIVTNIATALILIRSIYRMIDFSLGRTGYTEMHEWCLYVFDALPIFPVLALYIWWHPSHYLPFMNFRLPKHAR